jgi:hypothetical protein
LNLIHPPTHRFPSFRPPILRRKITLRQRRPPICWRPRRGRSRAPPPRKRSSAVIREPSPRRRRSDALHPSLIPFRKRNLVAPKIPRPRLGRLLQPATRRVHSWRAPLRRRRLRVAPRKRSSALIRGPSPRRRRSDALHPSLIPFRKRTLVAPKIPRPQRCRLQPVTRRVHSWRAPLRRRRLRAAPTKTIKRGDSWTVPAASTERRPPPEPRSIQNGDPCCPKNPAASARPPTTGYL